MSGRADPFADAVGLKADDFAPKKPEAPRASATEVAAIADEGGFSRPMRAKPAKAPVAPPVRRRRRRAPVSDEPKEQFNQRVYTADVDAYLEIAARYPTQADAFRAALTALKAKADAPAPKD